MEQTGARGVDPSEFVDLLEPAVRKAATLARAMEGRVANVPKRGETTRVKQALTAADTRTQEILLRALLTHFPDLSVEAEEDTESVGRFPTDADARVIIDPIDGTLHSYLEARGPYATIMGLVTDGLYTAGIVALPRDGLLFVASRGKGARIGLPGRRLRPASISGEGTGILVANNTPKAVVDHLTRRGFDVTAACGGAVSVAPLIPGVRAGLRCANADSAGISVRGRVGALISREAGALVRSGANGPFPEDPETPAPVLLVAGSEEDIAVLRDALEVGGLPTDSI